MKKAEILRAAEPIRENVAAFPDRRPVSNAKEIFDRGTRWRFVPETQGIPRHRTAQTL
jgi:hypothetical protein